MDDIISLHQRAARTWLEAARLELYDTMQSPEPLDVVTEQTTRALLEELAVRIERTIHPVTWYQAGSWEIEPEHLFALRAPSRLLGVPERPFYQLVWQRAKQRTPLLATPDAPAPDTREDILETIASLDFGALSPEQARACFEFLGLNRTQYAKRFGVARSTTLHWERAGVAAGPAAALLRLLFSQTKTAP